MQWQLYTVYENHSTILLTLLFRICLKIKEFVHFLTWNWGISNKAFYAEKNRTVLKLNFNKFSSILIYHHTNPKYFGNKKVYHILGNAHKYIILYILICIRSFRMTLVVLTTFNRSETILPWAAIYAFTLW